MATNPKQTFNGTFASLSSTLGSGGAWQPAISWWSVCEPEPISITVPVPPPLSVTVMVPAGAAEPVPCAGGVREKLTGLAALTMVAPCAWMPSSEALSR